MTAFPAAMPTLTVKVSFSSPVRSPFTSTKIVLAVSPAANVTSPEADW
jgi:hypothetical protein